MAAGAGWGAVAGFKCYLLNAREHIVKRCDLAADNLDLVVADARAVSRV